MIYNNNYCYAGQYITFDTSKGLYYKTKGEHDISDLDMGLQGMDTIILQTEVVR